MEPFLTKQKVRKFRGNGALDAKQFHWEIYILHSSEALHDFPISNMILIESNKFSESSKKSQISKLQWRNLCCASSCWAHNYHLPNFSEDESALWLWCHNFEWVSWCLRSGTMIELGQFNIYNHSFFKKVDVFSVTRLRNIKLIAAFDLFSYKL